MKRDQLRSYKDQGGIKEKKWTPQCLAVFKKMYQIWKLDAINLLYGTLEVNLKQSIKQDWDFEVSPWLGA